MNVARVAQALRELADALEDQPKARCKKARARREPLEAAPVNDNDASEPSDLDVAAARKLAQEKGILK